MKYPRTKDRLKTIVKSRAKRVKYTVKSLPSDFYLEQCARCFRFLPRGGMLVFLTALRHPLARLQ